MSERPGIRSEHVKLGWLALALAIAGIGAVALPGPGMYGSMSLGILGVGVGLVGYRRRADPGPARLAGAGGMAMGLVALTLGLTRYGLTLVALHKLERWLSG
jgi:hypothetical protein